MASLVDRLKVYTFGPAWGLPSIDPLCLKTLAYLQFSNVDYETIVTGNSRSSPTGSLPMINKGDVVAGEDDSDIFDALKRMGYDLDEGLSDADRAIVSAFSSLVDNRLYDCMLYAWWMDKNNYRLVTRPAYTGAYVWPLGQIVPRVMKRRVRERLVKAGLSEGTQKAYTRANDCYKALSAQLGNKEWFVAGRLSSLDAIVFGHLVLHLHAPMAKNDLRKQLLLYPNLVEFCNRILLNQFGVSPPDHSMDSTKYGEIGQSRSASQEEADRRFRERTIISVGLAVAVVGAYYVTVFRGGLR